LEELVLSGCVFLTDHGLRFLSKLTNLRILNLSKCSHITDWGMHHLRVLKKLHTLNLDGCDLLTENAVHLLRCTSPAIWLGFWFTHLSLTCFDALRCCCSRVASAEGTRVVLGGLIANA
jgi:hypothetical protein